VHLARERNRILREHAAEKNLAFRKSFIGRTLHVITLQTGGEGWTEALSDNYLKVRVAGQHPANEMLTVDVTDAGHEDLVAARRLPCLTESQTDALISSSTS
jgi:tRNA A37 methylthiotransferase MiaB